MGRMTLKNTFLHDTQHTHIKRAQCTCWQIIQRSHDSGLRSATFLGIFRWYVYTSGLSFSFLALSTSTICVVYLWHPLDVLRMSYFTVSALFGSLHLWINCSALVWTLYVYEEQWLEGSHVSMLHDFMVPWLIWHPLSIVLMASLIALTGTADTAVPLYFWCVEA